MKAKKLKDRNYLIYLTTLTVIIIVYLVIYIFGKTIKGSISSESGNYQHNVPPQPVNSIISIIEDRLVTFEYDDMGNYIDLRNQFPTPDEVGRSFVGNKYTQDFKLKLNPLAVGITYVITLEKQNDSTLEEEWAKVYLESDGEPVSSVFRENGKVKTFDEYDSYYNRLNEKVLYSGIVTIGESHRGYKNFTLKMWVSEDLKVFNQDYLERYFKANIKVYAVRV